MPTKKPKGAGVGAEAPVLATKVPGGAGVAVAAPAVPTKEPIGAGWQLLPFRGSKEPTLQVEADAPATAQIPMRKPDKGFAFIVMSFVYFNILVNL
jgi:hypothetical protein